jgi:hypothetical protein
VDNDDEAKEILNEMSENVESFDQNADEKAFSDMNSELRYPQAQHVRIRGTTLGCCLFSLKCLSH